MELFFISKPEFMQTSLDLYAVPAVLILLGVIVVYKTFKKPRESEDRPDSGKVGSLSRGRIAEMNQLVTDFIVKNKPFLQQRYSIAQLSADLQIPQHHLSAFINSYYKVNFNDLINKYRVYYSKIMMINEEWKYKTLQGIALESGFGNRTSFCNAFKKVTGLNPSDFIRELKYENGNNNLHLNKIKEDCLQKCPEMKILFFGMAS